MRRVLVVVAIAVGAACSLDDPSDTRPVDASTADSEPDVAIDASVDAADASADADSTLVDTAVDTTIDDTSEPEVAVDSGPPIAPADFTVPGTQMGMVPFLPPSPFCTGCHSGTEIPNGPYETWKGSLMAWAGKDPLFFAQLATATQDVPTVGYYCVRCHVPLAIVSGNAASGSEKALDDSDRDGVSCNFCHAMVDPKGATTPKDFAILGGLKEVPKTYGNAQFVLDPDGTRRGPYDLKSGYHVTIQSPFVKKSEMCGTCHDVGNPAISKLPDGTWFFNKMGAPAPDSDPHTQFPLERTFTEWSLSSFAKGGVSMKGRFGGEGADVVSTCQDCHMPVAKGRGCLYGLEHDDLRKHEFAGASAWVLRAIASYDTKNKDVLEAGALAAEAMVKKAATLELTRSGSKLVVKVINETGHKLPTGHIEGRRVFLSVQAFDSTGALVKDWGKWDETTGDLDEASTTVFEMEVGLSKDAASLTGLPAGRTTHMSVADVIVKDNRIPPRGFANAAFEAGGAPVVGATYADGQNWATVEYAMPTAAKKARVTLYYQTVTRHYVDALRDGNKTDDWGNKLHDAWESTGKGPPIAIATSELALP